jgi:FtsP/CotA-like multicopper oxidase with cupredoxin domain
MISRRTLCKLGVIAPAAFQLRGSDGWVSPRVTPFQVPLPAPAPLVPITDASLIADIGKQVVSEKRGFEKAGPPAPADADYYEMFISKATQSIIPGLNTEIWGYNGVYPGPTIRARVGRPILMRVHNSIDNRMVVHHHGGHTQPDCDGYPNQYILPGTPAQPTSRTFVYANSSTRSATLWYHDHVDAGLTGDEGTGHNVYFGLAGFFILGDDWESTQKDIRIPSGKYDIPMVFQDRLFSADGSLHYPELNLDGIIGDTFLVNGAIQPRLAVERRNYRFRFLNGCNARVIQLFLSTGEPFIQIGSDGGLLPSAFTTPSVKFAPGERIEVVVDFKKYASGTQLTLRNCLAQTDGRKPDGLVPLNAGVDFLRFDVGGDASDDTRIPADGQPLRPLTADEPGSPSDAVQTRDVQLERGHGVWLLNGQIFEPGRIDFTPQTRLGTSEIWRFTNSGGGWVHPMHIHMEEFRILDRNGIPVGPGEAGLKDMALVGENETVRVLVKFHDQPQSFLDIGGSSNVGFYAYHCHNLEHEDMHMMGTFGVQR